MSILFPAQLDLPPASLTNPLATDKLSASSVLHHTQHSDANDAIRMLEAKTGVDASLVTTSIDYLIKRPRRGDLKVIYTGTSFEVHDEKTGALRYAGETGLNAAFTRVKSILGTADTDTNGGRIYVTAASHNVKIPVDAPVALRNCHGYEIYGDGDGKCGFIASNVTAMQGTNDSSTTLSANVNSGAVTFSVADASSWPLTNFWVVLNDTEKVFCPSRAGNVITCEAIQTAGTPAFNSGQTVWGMGHRYVWDARQANRFRIHDTYTDCNSVQGLGGIIQIRVAGGTTTGGQNSFSKVARNTVKNFQAEAYAQGDYGTYRFGDGTSNCYWTENNAMAGVVGTGGFGDGKDQNRPIGMAMYNGDWHVIRPQLLGIVNGYAFAAWGASGQLDGSGGHIASTLDAGPIVLLGQGAPNSLIGNNLYLDNVGAHVTTLNGAIDNAQTTLALNTPVTSFPTAPFIMLVQNEYMLVGTRTGVNCSNITRGVRGTTAAAHADNTNAYSDNHAILIKPDNGQKCTLLELGGVIKINGSNNANEASDVIYCDVDAGGGTQVRELLVVGPIAGTGSSNKPMRSILNGSQSSRIIDIMMGGISQVALSIIGAPLDGGQPISYSRVGLNRAEYTGGGGGSTLTYHKDKGEGRVSATQSKTTDTALADMCAVDLAANCRYRIRGWVFYDASTAGDLKLQITAPAGATGTVKWTGLPAGAAASTDAPVLKQAAVGNPVSFGGVGAGTTLVAEFEGFVKLSTTGGNLSLQAAQQNSDAVATRIFADTGLTVESVEI